MKTTLLWKSWLIGIVLTFAASLSVFGITAADVAGIVYAETSGMRPIGQTAADLTTARSKIAAIAYKRNGDGLADPITPSTTEMQNPTVKAIWDDCVNVANSAAAVDVGDCKHFVIWPSTDGKVPTKSPALTANPPWPYTQIAKIKEVWGPFSIPTQVGDVPAGKNIYVFIYCGVQ